MTEMTMQQWSAEWIPPVVDAEALRPVRPTTEQIAAECEAARSSYGRDDGPESWSDLRSRVWKVQTDPEWSAASDQLGYSSNDQIAVQFDRNPVTGRNGGAVFVSAAGDILVADVRRIQPDRGDGYYQQVAALSSREASGPSTFIMNKSGSPKMIAGQAAGEDVRIDLPNADYRAGVLGWRSPLANYPQVARQDLARSVATVTKIVKGEAVTTVYYPVDALEASGPYSQPRAAVQPRARAGAYAVRQSQIAETSPQVELRVHEPDSPRIRTLYEDAQPGTWEELLAGKRSKLARTAAWLEQRAALGGRDPRVRDDALSYDAAVLWHGYGLNAQLLEQLMRMDPNTRDRAMQDEGTARLLDRLADYNDKLAVHILEAEHPTLPHQVPVPDGKGGVYYGKALGIGDDPQHIKVILHGTEQEFTPEQLVNGQILHDYPSIPQRGRRRRTDGTPGQRRAAADRPPARHAAPRRGLIRRLIGGRSSRQR